jgi:biotin carboxylase
MASILLLGASISQVPAIRYARDNGVRVVVVDGNEQAIGFPLADVAECVDFTDVARVVEVARRHQVEAVVAISSDRAVPAAAAIAERLGLPGIGVEVARVMTDKAAMRGRLAEQGVPQPRFVEVDGLAGALDALEQIGTPAVLKPVDSGGQRGVCRIDRPSDLRAQIESTLAYSRRRRAILESYVEGRELNAIAVVRDAEVTLLTLSDRLRPSGIGFGVALAHLFPSSEPESVLARAAATVTHAVHALGLRHGIAYPQLLVTDEGQVVVVEVAARIPAGQMSELVRFGIGVDLFEIAFLQALGRPVSDELLRPQFEHPVAIRFLTAEPGTLPVGRVASVGGLKRVQEAPGVLAAGLYLQAGEVIRSVQVDEDRRGYVIATGPNPQGALRAADAAALHLDVAVADQFTPVETAS